MGKNHNSYKFNRHESERRNQAQQTENHRVNSKRRKAFFLDNIPQRPLTFFEGLIVWLVLFNVLLPVIQANRLREKAGSRTQESEKPTLPGENSESEFNWQSLFSSEEALVQQINNVVQLDPADLADPAAVLEYEKVKAGVLEIVKNGYEHFGHVSRVLIHSNFKGIHCVAKNWRNIDPSNTNGATVTIGSHSIKVKVDGTVPDYSITINHEAMHEDTILRKENPPCQSTGGARGIPLFPLTEEMLDKYKEAFEVGHKRVERLRALISNLGDPKTLTANDITDLSRLFEGLQHLPSKPHIFSAPVSEEAYQIVKQKFQAGTNLVNDQLVRATGLIDVNIHDTILVNGQPTLFYSYAKLWDEIFDLPFRVKDKLNYYDQGKPAQMAELEPLVFSHLPRELAEFLYKEAYQMRREFVTKCPSTFFAQKDAALQEHLQANLEKLRKLSEKLEEMTARMKRNIAI